MKRYMVENRRVGAIEVNVIYEDGMYLVDYNELFGTEGRYIVPTENAVREVLRDLAEGGEIEEVVETIHDYVRELDSFAISPLGNWEAKDGDISFFEWGGDVSIFKGNEEVAVMGEATPITEVWEIIKKED